MVRAVCPRCNQVYIKDQYSGDYVHQCNSGIEVLDNEDVIVLGNWEDIQGGSHFVKSSNVRFAGMENELFGTKAQVQDGEDVEATTSRGNRESTHATRQHFEYIESEKNGSN